METKGKHKENNRGVAVILVVGVLVFFLIFFLVVGIDFAYIYLARGELQNAADSGSLGGVGKVEQKLDDPGESAYEQLEARREAWKFACENKAAGVPVFLEVSGPDNPCNPSGLSLSALNGTNDRAGDIVVGHWRQGDTPPSDPCNNSEGWQQAGSGYFCRADGDTGFVVNAVKVVARRTESSPGGRVGLIFGGLVGWPLMNVSQVAIAALPPRPSSAMSICIRTCQLTVPEGGLVFFFADAELKEVAKQVADQFCAPLSGGAKATCVGEVTDKIVGKNPYDPPYEGKGEYVLAFTEFSCEKPTNFGPDSLIAKFIRGELIAPNVCSECIRTNKAQPGQIMAVLKETFARRAENGIWRVIAPVADEAPPGYLCPNCNAFASTSDACPTEQQGSPQEPYLVVQYAELFISAITSQNEVVPDFSFIFNGVSYNITGLKGPAIRLEDIRCVDCPAEELQGEKAQLVK
jgi:hypothetical protein